jgi:hypothetical protein
VSRFGKNTVQHASDLSTESYHSIFIGFSLITFFSFYRKSEKSASIVRDDSYTNIGHNSDASTAHKRLASAPPENSPITSSTTNYRRSRVDNINSSHEYLPSTISSINDNIIPDIMSSSVTATSTGSGMGSSKNRFFSLSRRFRFRAQSPDKGIVTPPATVHFLDEDIDLETKERTTRKSDQHGHRPSKGILKTLRHRSPFRFRSKDAVIPEQEPSPPPPLSPPSSSKPSVPSPPPKENRQKMPPPAPTSTQTKHRGRLVELKKATSKPSSSNGTSRKVVSTTPNPEPTGPTLVRRASGLKDLIHKFEIIPSDRPPKPKRAAADVNASTLPLTQSNQDVPVKKATSYSDLSTDDQHRAPMLASTDKSKTIDIPDLLRNVEKDPTTTMIPASAAKAILRHSNSSRQTSSFDSATSMVSASESIITNSSIRRPTSTARPLMISLVSELIKIIHFILFEIFILEQR